MSMSAFGINPQRPFENASRIPPITLPEAQRKKQSTPAKTASVGGSLSRSAPIVEVTPTGVALSAGVTQTGAPGTYGNLSGYIQAQAGGSVHVRARLTQSLPQSADKLPPPTASFGVGFNPTRALGVDASLSVTNNVISKKAVRLSVNLDEVRLELQHEKSDGERRDSVLVRLTL